MTIRFSMGVSRALPKGSGCSPKRLSRSPEVASLRGTRLFPMRPFIQCEYIKDTRIACQNRRKATQGLCVISDLDLKTGPLE